MQVRMWSLPLTSVTGKFDPPFIETQTLQIIIRTIYNGNSCPSLHLRLGPWMLQADAPGHHQAWCQEAAESTETVQECNDKRQKRWKGRMVCAIPALFVISLVLPEAG